VRTAATSLTIIAYAHIYVNPSFVCTAADFQGSCAVFHGASGECVNFSNAFNDVISAIGPDSDQDCFFWKQVIPLETEMAALTYNTSSSAFGCSGEQLGPIRNPGITNLNQAGLTDFNDALSSFK
jgi:hypothetical protein